jgi:flagella basal body P-ring formation protein FlgA
LTSFEAFTIGLRNSFTARNKRLHFDDATSNLIQTLQCNLNHEVQTQALATEQYNGWLAASQLGLSYCTKLTAVGKTAMAISCRSLEVDFITNERKRKSKILVPKAYL